MRLLVTGKNGRIGWELRRSLQCLGEVLAVHLSEFELVEPSTLPAKLDALVPDVIVDAAAFSLRSIEARRRSGGASILAHGPPEI